VSTKAIQVADLVVGDIILPDNGSFEHVLALGKADRTRYVRTLHVGGLQYQHAARLPADHYVVVVDRDRIDESTRLTRKLLAWELEEEGDNRTSPFVERLLAESTDG